MSPEALSAIAACASAIVAACALIFTWWQYGEARAQRLETERQNRMGVRPLLTFTRSLLNLEGEPVGILIANSGLGPAIIKKISVMERATKRIAIGERALREIFYPITESLGMTSEVQHTWIDEGAGIRPGETVKLLWVRHASKFQMDMLELMACVRIKLEYESMYEESRDSVYLHSSEDFTKKV